ncbi:hypothetical protein OGH69_03850 [Flavobacterium sp. MFBS3-15]|uniref:hypothetical protein n=1 Tax=Flavobacterium sp. MFBS3-15 TaxID=2989816 RepID=UPI002235EBEC|nr:hypothetical protein [Flavobacterium sp. MFBS3-15]MCW4468089.1 hypothetical protein [Flavobacterium sp. MFBS3-15]
MKISNLIKNGFYTLAVIAMGMITGCSPEEETNGNPLTMADMDAAFTATTPEGNAYTFTGSDDPNIHYHTWKFTYDGPYEDEVDELEESRTQENVKQITFIYPGTYTVQHRVVGKVGGTNFVSQQVFEVTDLFLGPNIVVSPNFEDASDWTTFNTSGTQTVTWSFNAGSATANGGVANAWSGQGIYQAVQVEAGTYLVDMHVEGPGGNDQMWFQVFTGATQPVNGSDYGSDPEAILGLNTWAGCGIAPFNGMLSSVGCVGSGSQVEFNQAGTIYLVIKTGTGSNNGVKNITVSGVSMRKLP